MPETICVDRHGNRYELIFKRGGCQSIAWADLTANDATAVMLALSEALEGGSK